MSVHGPDHVMNTPYYIMMAFDAEDWSVYYAGHGWRLDHKPCDWFSNVQDGDRTVRDILRWIGHHLEECDK